MQSLLNLFLYFLPLLYFKSVHTSDPGKVYTVVSTRIPPQACLADSCLTLSQFANNFSNYIASNTTLIITRGNHSLDAGIFASNVAEFDMLSSNITYQASKPIITCTRSGNFNFSNIGRIRIKGLKFESCNGNKFKFIHQLAIEYSTFFDSKSPLTIINSNVNMIGACFLFNSGSYKRDFALQRFVEHQDQSFNKLNASIGGALILICTTTAIKNCDFKGNSATFGGAIFSELNNSITISNSNFSHNQAKGCISGYCAGGAIVINERGKMTVNNTTFYNNTSDFDGGVAVIINATLQFSHSYISSNAANRYGGVLAAFKNSNFILEGTLLYNNKAEHDGGTVYLHKSNTTIIICEILCSNARGDGGAIYGTHGSSIKVNNSLLKANKAQEGNGGALYGQNQSTMDINKCEFIYNIATSGGTIDVNLNSTLNIVSSNFSDNNASDSGGVAHVHNKSMVFIQHCNFINNRAAFPGGAVLVEKSSKMNISGCNIVNNVASYGGGLDIRITSIANIAFCSFERNSAKNNGAALHVYISCKVTITGSVFTWNIANNSGAAVYGRRHCNISIIESLICNCTADFSGGGAYLGHDSNIHVENCTFLSSRADFGGAIRAYVRTNMTILNSSFDQNRATIEGGALHAYRNSSITVQSSSFISNKARSGGVALTLLNCELTFQNSTIINSSADFGGVTGLLEGSMVNIIGGTFIHNTAQSGGVLYVHRSEVVVKMSATFSFNSAVLFGGVIHANDNCTITISTVTFSNNTADYGGSLSLLDNSSGLIQYSDFVNSQANSNGGAIYVNNASIRVYSSGFNSSSAFMHGGILSISSASTVYLAGSNFSHGTAKLGAALAIIEKSTLSFILQSDLTEPYINNSEMSIRGTNDILINNSTAIWSGGGIYLRESSLCIETETTIMFNEAGSFGGGIHAINSSIIVNHIIHFVSNKATSGGGLSLSNSKFHDVICEAVTTRLSMNFVSNQADNGGALYSNDKDIADVCFGQNSSTISGCFFQNMSDAFIINFNKNQAKYKGKDLFGGLLDRCTIASSSTNQSQLESNGVARFKNISNSTTLEAISSKPVQVCFCENHKPNCSIRSKAVEVKHRDTILLELAAIDQVNHKLIATIQSHIDGYELSANQATQTIGAACSNISYHITAPPREDPYKAIIYADGPCGDKGISKLTVHIKVVQCKCAIGLVDNNNDKECKCKCDQQLLNYHGIQKCNPDKDSVEREGVFWIAVTYTDDGNFTYLFFPYCPMSYCQSSDKLIHVNLSQTNGSDVQCANNHAGLLCGKCQPHYSLSLGSSKCIKCHKEWRGELIGIIIAALFAGIFLVAIILVLNLTVAVGTLNSIIFYANIVYSNRIFRQSQFISVFIFWLNLDIGFDVCFYEGMDAYTKTWLELAFPAYIIFLVIAIIWISSRSSTFTNLIGKRNPVATLATLLLISYTKFLQTIIITFSFVKSNGSIEPATRWLYDASIVYFGWKHSLLFFTAVVILIFGLFYTILLFSWQWLLHCPRSKVFYWTWNQKLHSFIDTYHTPHMPKHRYWTGLLLLARVILYLISAFSTSVYADPHIPLLAMIIAMCGLLLFKTVMMIKVYRNWLLNAMDSFICFNIIIPAIFTLHSFTDQTFQTKVINVSVGITLVLLCFIIAFHVYKYGSGKLYAYCQNTKFCESMTKWLLFIQSQEKSSSSPSDGRLLDVLDSLRQDDEVYDQQEEPTSSVVSLVHSEESPSSDYCLKLNKGDYNQSDYQVQSDKGNIKLRERAEISTQIRSTCNNTKKYSLSCNISKDDSIRKPLLDEHL